MARPVAAPAPHGTRARYYATGAERCRCDACRKANARYQSMVRAKASPVERPEQLRLPADLLRSVGYPVD